MFLCYYYDVFINTNYIINAQSKTDAMEIAKKMEDTITKNIKLFYDSEKKDIVVEIVKNPYFDEAFVTNYTFYDITKEEIDDSYVQHNKEEFINLLKEEFNDYFSIGNYKLPFECVAYSVRNYE